MYKPKKIIDSHIHLITSVTHSARLEWMSGLDENLRSAYRERWANSLNSRKEGLPESDPPNVAEVAALWEQELDRAGVERAVFFTSTETHQEIIRFIALNPKRFCGYTTFDPTNAANAELLDIQVTESGVRGLKLYPMARHFRVNDPECFPVYRVCERHGLPVIIHFGLSINATHDLSFGNPLDVSTPAVRFPSVKWIVPHFGTGLFREALLVAAQYRNVFIDTSSSNDWIKHSPFALTHEDLFRRTYESLGSKRIVFGTDSSFFPRGFRSNILDQQLTICNELGLSQSEIDDVFFANIAEILGLDADASKS